MANWKMNLGIAESLDLARKIVRQCGDDLKRLELVVFPSFPALPGVQAVLGRSGVRLGSQDMFWSDVGSFTGAVSPTQLAEVGCTWSLIGHSERREHLGETDEMIDRKTAAALRFNITPVVCVGETREERNSGRSELIVGNQIRAAFRYVRPPFPSQRIIIAYEPRWSISPGLPCEPDDAKTMALVIRQALIDRYDVDRAYANFTIAYGGSADHANVANYLEGEEIDGVLVGHASQAADRLLPLIAAVAKTSSLPTKKRPLIKTPSRSKPSRR
jgi:triosephosphate isomerase